MSRLYAPSTFLSKILLIWFWVVSSYSLLSAPSEEVGYLHVNVETQRIEFRFKFSLQTLQKFIVLDSDRDGILAKHELSGQEMALREYLNRQVPITLNGRETNVGFPSPLERQWADAKKGKDVPLAEFGEHWVEFTFTKSGQPLITDVGILFKLFKDASGLARIELEIEQSGNSSRMSITPSNPEHRWKTSFSADSAATAAPPPSKGAEESSSGLVEDGPFMIVFGLVALAVTWLLLRRVHKISRGSFYIGPRE